MATATPLPSQPNVQSVLHEADRTAAGRAAAQPVLADRGARPVRIGAPAAADSERNLRRAPTGPRLSQSHAAQLREGRPGGEDPIGKRCPRKPVTPDAPRPD